MEDVNKYWLAPADVCLLCQARSSELAETCEGFSDMCFSISDDTLDVDIDYMRFNLYKRLFDLNRDIKRFMSNNG